MDLTWRQTLKARRAAHKIRFAVSGDAIGWSAGEPAPPRVVILDRSTGVELHREICATTELFPTSAGFLAQDLKSRSSDQGASQLVAFACSEGRVVVRRLELPDGTSLKGADARQDRYLLSCHRRAARLRSSRKPPLLQDRNWWAELRAWTQREPLAIWRPRAHIGVDWDAEALWGIESWSSADEPYTPPAELVLDAIDGSWRHEIALARRSSGVKAVGCGVLRLGHHGIYLFRPGQEVLTVLPASARELVHIHVVDSGRTVRTVLGGEPRRFTIDLDNHLVLRAPRDAVRLARAPRRKQMMTGLAWHPTLDLVALTRRWPRCAVYDGDGEFLWQLPDHTLPRAWLTAPDALLTIRSQDEQTATLELWSHPQ